MTVIAIDGPSGAGKSTLARALSERLGIRRLDTGAMYRAVALLAIEGDVDPGNEEDLAHLAREATLEVGDLVLVNGKDVTEAIRGTPVTSVVSQISAHPKVRAALVARQRAWVDEQGSGVVEGRDISSVVLPEADVKIYLTADPTERARRRTTQLAGSQLDSDGALSVSVVKQEMDGRDARDQTRAVSPLVIAQGAVVIDSTHRDVEDVVRQILSML